MISRFINLPELLTNNTSSFLLGPRGTGKSSLAKQFLELQKENGKRTFAIDLLSLRQLSRYANNPELFRKDIEYLLLQDKRALVVLIDEVQKLPGLLDEVHYFLESKDKGTIQFLLTGSSARKLRRGGANLLAGRATSLTLHPLSVLELELHLERALQYGTLPRFYLESEDDHGIGLLLESYVDTYLKEEVQSERLVRALAPFQRFLAVAAQMNGKPVNFSAIARDVSISDQTVRDYYSILLDTYLAFELPAWSRSIRKQLRQASKFYFFDTGVLNTLLGEQELVVVPGNRRYGGLFENFIVTEFFRQADYLRIRKQLHYWRTAQSEEIDLLIDCGLSKPPIAIEIKPFDSIGTEKLKAFHLLKEEFPAAKLFCICRTAHAYEHEGITFLPWQSGVKEVLLTALQAGKS